MRTSICLLVILPVFGVYSAQLALLPAQNVYAAPIDYTQVEAGPIAAREEGTFNTLFGLNAKKHEAAEKRDEEALIARDEEETRGAWGKPYGSRRRSLVARYNEEEDDEEKDARGAWGKPYGSRR